MIKKTTSHTKMQLKDYKLIQLRRIQLEKIVKEPYLAQYVENLFCKISVGISKNSQTNVYRCCRIIKMVNYNKSYQFAGISINKALLLAIGKQTRVFPFTQLSNSSLTELETNEWLKLELKNNKAIPSAEQVLLLKKEKDNLRHNFIYTDELVQQIIAQKRNNNQSKYKNINIFVYKMQLKSKLEIAEKLNENKSHIQQLKDELNELKTHEMNMLKRLENDKAKALVTINKRNKKRTKSNFAQGYQQQQQLQKKDNKNMMHLYVV